MEWIQTYRNTAILLRSGVETASQSEEVLLKLNLTDFQRGILLPRELTSLSSFDRFLLPQAREETLSSLLSRIDYTTDMSVIQLWIKESISSFSYQAALTQEAISSRRRGGRLVLSAEIYIFKSHTILSTDPQLLVEDEEFDEMMQLLEEEIAETLQLLREDEEIEEDTLINDDDDGGDHFGGIPASSVSIQKLEVARYQGGVDGFREECAICLEDFDLDMNVMRMPCSHIFHGHCLTQWLERSHLCPLCRFEMPLTAGGDT